MVALSFGSLGEASVEIRASLGKLGEDLNKARGQVASGLDKIGTSLKSTGQSLSTALTLPLTLFGGLSLKVAGDFEQAMNRVAAVSGAAGEQLAALEEQARSLGATTQFSATQAADAMSFLAQAGFKADEIISVMPDTLKLAAAAQLEMGSAADIVSNIMAGFQIKNEDLSKAVDVLTKAFTSSNTDLVQLGEAMKYVGPVASAAGLSFEETAAAAGLLGNAGLQASLAGTALRGAISHILNPGKEASDIISELGLSFTDSGGRIKDLTSIITELEPHAQDAGLFLELFGQRAGPAMAALAAQGSDALRALTIELENSGGAADKIASVQMEGLNGAIRELKSAFEELLIALADSGLLEFVTNIARQLSAFLREVGKADPQLLKLATVIGAVALAIGPVVVSLGVMATAIGALLTPVGAVVAAFAVGGTLLVAITTFGDEGFRILSEFVSAVVSLFTGPFNTIVDAVQGTLDNVIGFFQSASDVIVGNSIVPDMVEMVIGEFLRLKDETSSIGADISDELTNSFAGTSDKVSDIFSDAANSTSGFSAELRELSQSISGTSGPLSGMITLLRETSNTQRDMASDFSSTVGFIGNSLHELFGESKAYALADAIIQTALAVTKALSSAPYPYNLALAAAVGALGAIQISTISAQEFAKGGIIERGRVLKKFARGAVVDRPTTFSLQNGLGMMAEAGPEAIMPLAQTSRGLGVTAAGMSVPQVDVHVSIVNPPQRPRVEDRGDGRVDVIFDEAVANQFRPGTATSRALKQRYNLDFATRR